MHPPKEFIKHVNDALFSTNRISHIHKLTRGCGSTTLIVKYALDRMEYENDFHICMIFDNSKQRTHTYNMIQDMAGGMYDYANRDTIINHENNNKISLKVINNSEMRGFTVHHFILTDIDTYKINKTDLDYKIQDMLHCGSNYAYFNITLEHG